MGFECCNWGAGREFGEREYTWTPYTDQTASESHLWFMVDTESQVVGEIRLAGRRWRLVEAYTSDGPYWLPFSALQPGCLERPHDPVYWLVYERVGGPPRSSCGSGRFT